jgi:hypothetical protein
MAMVVYGTSCIVEGIHTCRHGVVVDALKNVYGSIRRVMRGDGDEQVRAIDEAITALHIETDLELAHALLQETKRPAERTETAVQLAHAHLAKAVADVEGAWDEVTSRVVDHRGKWFTARRSLKTHAEMRCLRRNKDVFDHRFRRFVALSSLLCECETHR